MSQAGKVEAGARLERLRAYLHADPANIQLALDAAAQAREVGDLQIEADVLVGIARQHPDHAEIMHALGINALQRHDFRGAALYFEGLLAVGNDHPVVRYNMAFAQLYAGEPQAAIAALMNFGEQDWAALPQAHKLFAQAICQSGEDGQERAISHLQAYLELQPDDAEARGLLALILFDEDRAEEAEAQIRATLQRQADEPHALLARGGLALERQEAREAAEAFDSVLLRHAENGRAWSGRAFAYMLDLDRAAALEAFSKAVKYMPGHIGTWHGLAWLQLMAGDQAGAKHSFANALALDRNFGETHGGLAVLAALSGQAEDAKRLTRVGRGLNPQNFSARFAESLLLAAEGERGKAEEIIQGLLNSTVAGEKPVSELARSLLERRRAARARREQEPGL